MDIASLDTGYVPGVCNIGKAERALRTRMGVMGLVASLVGGVVLVYLGAPWPWRLLEFLPAALAASGFLQGAFGFCVGFASRGVFNFGGQVGQTTAVADAEARRKDGRKTLQLNLLTFLAAGAATAVVVFWP